MDSSRFERLLVGPDATLREAAQGIDDGGVEIALVVDADRRLLGTISDGDLRRALLRGADLDDGIDVAIHPNPISAPVGADREMLISLMTGRAIEQVPLLEDGCVVDVAFIHDVAGAPETPVIVMAGGEGQRLRPLTESVPKPMLPVGDDERPLLETTLRQLAGSGFRRVVLSVNYRADVIRHHFGDGQRFGLDISYVEEDRPLGSAGAIGLARDRLREQFIVMNADLLTSVSLGALIRMHVREGNLITIGLRQYQLKLPYGVVELQDDRVTELREKPRISFLVNAGIYAVDPRAIDLMPKDTMVHMTDLVEAALGASERVGSFPVRECWIDIGELSDYERAHSDYNTYFTTAR
jgi:dTDP-glucose pyrophosphorylase